MQHYSFWVYPDDIRRQHLSNAFPNIIGQEAAVETLKSFAFNALGQEDHSCPVSVVLVGSPSTGKTHISKAFASLLGIVDACTDATQLRSNDKLIDVILDSWSKTVLVTPDRVYGEMEVYDLDSTVVFIDEVHCLTRSVQDGLLKATERSDGMLFGKNRIINCRKFTWICATTNWGLLTPAFRTRLMRIDLHPYTSEEVAQILEHNLSWGMELCRKVVYYAGTVPREALQFARLVESTASYTGGSIESVIPVVATREGIDSFGMRWQRLRILQVLQPNPSGLLLRQLVAASGLESEELLRHWLPPMTVAAPGSSALVSHTGRYFITAAGEAELARRNFPQ